MASNNDNLPGFSKNSANGRYYFQGEPNTPFYKKTNEEKLFINPNVKNTVCYLSSRQMRAVGGIQEGKEYFKMRSFTKSLLEDTSLNSTKYQFQSVDMIRACESGVFGIWETVDTVAKYKKRPQYTVGVTHYEIGSHSSINDFVILHKYAKDICNGPEESITVLYNDVLINYFAENFYLNGVRDTFGYPPQDILRYPNQDPIARYPYYCCGSTKTANIYAFGAEDRIYVCSQVDDGFYCAQGKIHAIDFSDNGTLMVSGNHRGKLFIHNTTTKETICSINVAHSCLIECLVADNFIYAAGADDELYKIDIRKFEVVAEYCGHKQGMRKKHLSVAYDLLCATGSDNVIRLWHLGGGLPIHEIYPIHNSDNTIRGCLRSIGNRLFLYYFEEDKKKVFRIV